MKIAIPLDENRLDICQTFGRAPYFMFCCGGEMQILPNPAANAQSGAGLQAAQFVIDQEADALITVRCGQNAADVFAAAQVDIFQPIGVGAWDNAQTLEAGGLERLTHFHGGYHGIR